MRGEVPQRFNANQSRLTATQSGLLRMAMATLSPCLTLYSVASMFAMARARA